MDLATIMVEEMDSGGVYDVKQSPVDDPRELSGVTIGILTGPCPEAVEATYPIEYFRARGATVEVVSPAWVGSRVPLTSFWKPTRWLPVDRHLEDINSTSYNILFVPGGAWNPITIRTNQGLLDLLNKAYEQHVLVTSVCHGPQVLISAGLVKGRKLTGVPDTAIDIRNAGGEYSDVPVVRDGTLITGRDPNALPELCDTILQAFRESR